MTMRGAAAIVAAGAVAAVAGATSSPAAATQGAAVGETSIAGVVRSADGPEAGVWVIAETDDLETGFRKIVVTGDDGRFLIPELATAAYDVWVRGYGLADSERRTARPGDEVELTVSAAATPQEAASVYPANYWYSLIEVPPPADFPGTGDNGINPGMRTQEHFIDGLKDGCQLCHQLGNEATREMPMVDLDEFDSTADAWAFRLGTGATGSSMIRQINEMGRQRTLDVYADWTDRILAGEVPAAPPRPSGVERNLVLTMWKWSSAQKHVHDNIATDKRNPRLNANGPVYGILGDNFVAVDPATHQAREWVLPMRDAMRPAVGVVEGAPARRRALPSLYWDEAPGYGAASGHNPMMDAEGRVWLTSAIRPAGNPEWCRDGSHPSSAYYPVERSTRQVSYYDPEADEFVFIDSCYTTHHLQFAEDADDTLWFSGDIDVVGWLNTRLYDRSGDEQAAQGWCPTVIDTNGDGAITKPWNEPGEATDAARDTRLDGFAYGIIPNPADGSIWITRGSMSGPATEFPGSILRLDPGESPPETCIAEVYEPPFENPAVGPEGWGFGPRGIDVGPGKGELRIDDSQTRVGPQPRTGVVIAVQQGRPGRQVPVTEPGRHQVNTIVRPHLGCDRLQPVTDPVQRNRGGILERNRKDVSVVQLQEFPIADGRGPVDRQGDRMQRRQPRRGFGDRQIVEPASRVDVGVVFGRTEILQRHQVTLARNAEQFGHPDADFRRGRNQLVEPDLRVNTLRRCQDVRIPGDPGPRLFQNDASPVRCDPKHKIHVAFASDFDRTDRFGRLQHAGCVDRGFDRRGIIGFDERKMRCLRHAATKSLTAAGVTRWRRREGCRPIPSRIRRSRPPADRRRRQSSSPGRCPNHGRHPPSHPRLERRNRYRVRNPESVAWRPEGPSPTTSESSVAPAG